MDKRTELGKLGEDMAAAHLQERGYTILCRNFRRPCGEIDIIAVKDEVTYFVEVKTRSSSDYANPADSVTRRKRRQIANAAMMWFAEQGKETFSTLLVAEVYLENARVELIEDFLL